MLYYQQKGEDMKIGQMKLTKSDRTRLTQYRYQDDMRRGETKSLLDEKIKVDFNGTWRLIKNRYPWDEKWGKHDMLVYYKKCSWEDVPDEHLVMLSKLEISLLETNYERSAKNGEKQRSVHDIPHVHLLGDMK